MHVFIYGFYPSQTWQRVGTVRNVFVAIVYDLQYGCRNPRSHVDVIHNVPKVTHKICGFSVWNLHLAPTQFTWLLDLCKICAPLFYTEILKSKFINLNIQMYVFVGSHYQFFFSNLRSRSAI